MTDQRDDSAPAEFSRRASREQRRTAGLQSQRAIEEQERQIRQQILDDVDVESIDLDPYEDIETRRDGRRVTGDLTRDAEEKVVKAQVAEQVSEDEGVEIGLGDVQAQRQDGEYDVRLSSGAQEKITIHRAAKEIEDEHGIKPDRDEIEYDDGSVEISSNLKEEIAEKKRKSAELEARREAAREVRRETDIVATHDDFYVSGGEVEPSDELYEEMVDLERDEALEQAAGEISDDTGRDVDPEDLDIEPGGEIGLPGDLEREIAIDSALEDEQFQETLQTGGYGEDDLVVDDGTVKITEEAQRTNIAEEVQDNLPGAEIVDWEGTEPVLSTPISDDETRLSEIGDIEIDPTTSSAVRAQVGDIEVESDTETGFADRETVTNFDGDTAPEPALQNVGEFGESLISDPRETVRSGGERTIDVSTDVGHRATDIAKLEWEQTTDDIDTAIDDPTEWAVEGAGSTLEREISRGRSGIRSVAETGDEVLSDIEERPALSGTATVATAAVATPEPISTGAGAVALGSLAVGAGAYSLSQDEIEVPEDPLPVAPGEVSAPTSREPTIPTELNAPQTRGPVTPTEVDVPASNEPAFQTEIDAPLSRDPISPEEIAIQMGSAVDRPATGIGDLPSGPTIEQPDSPTIEQPESPDLVRDDEPFLFPGSGGAADAVVQEDSVEDVVERSEFVTGQQVGAGAGQQPIPVIGDEFGTSPGARPGIESDIGPGTAPMSASLAQASPMAGLSSMAQPTAQAQPQAQEMAQPEAFEPGFETAFEYPGRQTSRPRSRRPPMPRVPWPELEEDVGSEERDQPGWGSAEFFNPFASADEILGVGGGGGGGDTRDEPSTMDGIFGGGSP